MLFNLARAMKCAGRSSDSDRIARQAIAAADVLNRPDIVDRIERWRKNGVPTQVIGSAGE
jgi:hypothetical protein